MVKVAGIQMSAVKNIDQNLQTVANIVDQVMQDDIQIFFLPECFANALGENPIITSQRYKEIISFLKNICLKYNVWIVAGTIPYLADKSNHLCHARCAVLNNKGIIVGCYDKIHLFDANVEETNGSSIYEESRDYLAGSEPVVVNTPLGKLGLTVCYDLRFPELFRLLLDKGAEVICVPSAFTKITGQAHWEVLLRARAIENQCYIVAPNQVGCNEFGRESCGHSMIVDPWGTVLANAEEQINSAVIAEISPLKLRKVRNSMPIVHHRRFQVQT